MLRIKEQFKQIFFYYTVYQTVDRIIFMAYNYKWKYCQVNVKRVTKKKRKRKNKFDIIYYIIATTILFLAEIRVQCFILYPQFLSRFYT